MIAIAAKPELVELSSPSKTDIEQFDFPFKGEQKDSLPLGLDSYHGHDVDALAPLGKK